MGAALTSGDGLAIPLSLRLNNMRVARLLEGDLAMTALVTLFALVPRVIRPDIVEYKFDEASAVLSALAIARGEALPTHAAFSSYEGVYHGPVLYYFLAALVLFGAGPQLLTVAIGVVNALAVGMSYFVTRQAFGRGVAILSAAMFAVAPWSLVFSRKLWSNDLLPFVGLFILWGLSRAVLEERAVVGLGKAWIAAAFMSAIHLSALPVAITIGFVQVLVPRTRQGRALIGSLVGLAFFVGAFVLQFSSLSAVVAGLANGSGVQTADSRTFDLTSLTYVQQLAGNDAYWALAGPNDELESRFLGLGWIGHGLEALVVVGVIVAIARTLIAWRQRGHLLVTLEIVVTLWLIVPALAGVYRSSPLFIHHFLPTLPAQFILAALALTSFGQVCQWAWRRFRPESRFLEHFGRFAVGGLLVTFLVLQLRMFSAYLAYVEAHPSSTFFGVPLGATQEAVARATGNGQTRLVASIDGDEIGYVPTPTVLQSIAPDAALRFFDIRYTLLLDGSTHPSYLLAPGASAYIESIAEIAGLPIELEPLPGGYARATLEAGALLDSSRWRSIDLRFEDGAHLIGFRTPRQIVAGTQFEVAIHWRAGQIPADPVRENVFAHLADASGQSLVGADHHVFAGAWQADDSFISVFRLTPPADLPAGRYDVIFGRYRQPSLKPVRLVGDGGTSDVSSIRIGPLAVKPEVQPSRDLTPAGVDFGNQVRLEGWSTSQADDGLTVELSWRALESPTDDLTVFVQLLDAGNRLVAQDDSPPVGGTFPTLSWQQGDVVVDRHQLELRQVPPGHYRLIVGLYRSSTLERLHVGAEDAIDLGTITIDE